MSLEATMAMASMEMPNLEKSSIPSRKSLTVQELRKKLVSLGLDPSGKRLVLLNRLKNYLDKKSEIGSTSKDSATPEKIIKNQIVDEKILDKTKSLSIDHDATLNITMSEQDLTQNPIQNPIRNPIENEKFENTEILTEENDLSKNEQELSLKKPVSEDSNKYPEKSEAMPDQNESSENLIVQENISGGTGITKIRDSGSSKIEIFFSSFSCTNICHI